MYKSFVYWLSRAIEDPGKGDDDNETEVLPSWVEILDGCSSRKETM